LALSAASIINEYFNTIQGGKIMKKGIVILVSIALLAITSAGCSSKVNPEKTSTAVEEKGSTIVEENTAVPTEEEKLSELKMKLDKKITDYFGTSSFSGYVYISKKGDVLLDKAYGKADFEKGIENTKQTKFDIASLTKQFTALSIMQLEEKKLLNVNDTIDKYLPAFPHGNEITLHQLLNHTSGLAQHPELYDIRKFRPSNKGFGIEGKSEKVDLITKPGTSFQYSNAGYILLGYIIEKVSDKTLDVYFKENIFQPLDMLNTGFKDENGELNNLAAGYQSESKEKAEKSWYLTNVGPVIGSAALCSTVEDLIKWENALKEQKLISKESYVKIYTPNKDLYGYGWYIFKDSQGRLNYEHYGNASGYRSYVLRIDEEDVVFIFTSNFQNAPLTDMINLVRDNIK
jgi:CubicO group peptidase (beta-lactamase class C family)